MEAQGPKPTYEIDCKFRGYAGLEGGIFKDRFKIIKALSKGANGNIYMIEDAEANGPDRNKALKL